MEGGKGNSKRIKSKVRGKAKCMHKLYIHIKPPTGRQSTWFEYTPSGWNCADLTEYCSKSDKIGKQKMAD